MADDKSAPQRARSDRESQQQAWRDFVREKIVDKEDLRDRAVAGRIAKRLGLTSAGGISPPDTLCRDEIKREAPRYPMWLLDVSFEINIAIRQ